MRTLGAVAVVLFAIRASAEVDLRQIYLEQKLGAQIPADAPFVDESGNAVRLGDYFGQKPLILVLGYYTCPDLCPMTFSHLTEELNGIGPVAGRDFQVAVISFDPKDTPARALDEKKACLRAYKQPAAAGGWHFLTGKPGAIAQVAGAVGFHYAFDQKQQRFVHPTGVMVFSPGGRLMHCFFGIDAAPADMEAAIHDAGAGKATAVDQPDQEYCVDYDPTLSERGKLVTRFLDAGCVAWVVTLFGYIGFKISRDVRRGKSGVPS